MHCPFCDTDSGGWTVAIAIVENRTADAVVQDREAVGSSGDAADARSRFGRCADLLHSPRLRRLAVPAIAVTLLAIHVGLLAYAATRHSPTLNEPGHLVAGLSYWEFGRFEVYRVNPPLTRLVAALPVVAAGYEMDWSRFYEGPGARPEFALGADFIKANGERSIWLFTIARWACIPISLLGGTFCFLWGRELYGTLAGLASLTLWCFGPNILAHAELITPDAAATTFGIGAGYAFWRWLKMPTWSRAGLAGLFLGLAQLSKMSWLFLFGLWPLLWLVWQASGRRQPSETSKRRQTLQLASSLLLGLYLLNLAYAFDGSFTQLKEFTFVSETLAGEEDAGQGGNRFAGSRLGELPVPLPAQYVLGLDTQKRDFEDYGQPSYLRGEWRDHGWWYYYLYGCLVKVPHGTQLLFVLAVVVTIWQACRASGGRQPSESADAVEISPAWRDEFVLLAPAVCLFMLVSSQTEFSHHFRYVLPSLGLLAIFLGKPIFCLPRGFRWVGWRLFIAILASLLLTASVSSSVRVHPHSLAYFNEGAGGPENGWRHLLGSNLDWGQDLVTLKLWRQRQGHKVAVVYHGSYDPLHIDPELYFTTCGPQLLSAAHREVFDNTPSVVVSVNHLYGMPGLLSATRTRTTLQRHHAYVRIGCSLRAYPLAVMSQD